MKKYCFALSLVLLFGARENRAQQIKDPVPLLQQYLRVDTTNPPGNELRAANFWKKFFDAHGVESKIFAMSKTRGNILARIPGNGSRRPLILLNHLDVVPANAREWTQPPFAGKIDGGFLYGRGAIDMKGSAVCYALAMVAAKCDGWKLDRDLIFLGTADEEVGFEDGAAWMLKNHADQLRNAELVLTEGATIAIKNGKSVAWHVGVAEKTRLELQLVARGKPDHASQPQKDSAIRKLVAALHAIDQYEPPVVVTPSVRTHFRQLAEHPPLETPVSPTETKFFLDIDAGLKDHAFRNRILANPELSAMLRNTVSVTVLKAGDRANVHADEATANLDIRLLPGQKSKDFIATLKAIVAEPTIEFKTVEDSPDSMESSTNTVLFRAIEKARDRFDPGIPLMTPLETSTTDSAHFRHRGMIAYGFEPLRLSEEEDRAHGNDERVSLEGLRFTSSVVEFIVREVVAQKK